MPDMLVGFYITIISADVHIQYAFIFSAGGLATYLHADYVRSKVPTQIPVHAIADAG